MYNICNNIYRDAIQGKRHEIFKEGRMINKPPRRWKRSEQNVNLSEQQSFRFEILFSKFF